MDAMDAMDAMDTVISTDGTPIAYQRTGGGPPLVLVHGTTADHTRWRSIAMDTAPELFAELVMDFLQEGPDR
jgi:pimeloyl-ACP methyl ester carboxylesterase